MARTAALYRLWNRNGTFYYRLRGWTSWRSTGCKSKSDALELIEGKIREMPPAPRKKVSTGCKITLRAYLAPFYTSECPHVQRLRTEQKSIGDYHIHACRQLIVNKIYKDPIANLMVQDLRRADILDFRNRLVAHTGLSATNRTIAVLKTCIAEGIYREELQRNPCAGIGNIKYKTNESGTFTAQEITALFSDCPGPWSDSSVYIYFLLLYSCGLRRGEGLALQWGDFDFDQNVLSIKRTLQNNGKPKLPKWGKVRECPLPEFTAQALKQHRTTMERILPADWVFVNEIGEVRRHHWAYYHFHKAMKVLDIDLKGRSLRIHSFRHSAHSHLLAKGYSPELARMAFGWSDISTQRGYLHLRGEDMAEQGKIIDGMFKKS